MLVKGGMTAGKVMESDGAKVENITGADYDLGGSPTNAEVRDVSKHMTMISRTSFIAGHMLNKHLGGAVTDNKNIRLLRFRHLKDGHFSWLVWLTQLLFVQLFRMDIFQQFLCRFHGLES